MSAERPVYTPRPSSRRRERSATSDVSALAQRLGIPVPMITDYLAGTRHPAPWIVREIEQWRAAGGRDAA
jgi:hypothetical protein